MTVVGFVGLGHMGGPMCRNIAGKSGAEVVAYDLDPAAVAGCVEVGAAAAGSVGELAERADVLFTSLPGPVQMEAVALGPGGIAEHARAETVYFDLTTNSVSTIKRVAAELAKRQITLLDAPVSGGPSGATEGTLSIMVSGPREAYDAHLDLLRSFAGSPTHLGDLGNGTVAKLVNNMIALCTVAAAAEGLMLGTMAGLDPAVLDDVIRSSSGDSIAYRALADRALAANYEADFALDLCYKDIHLALELADELGVPVGQGAQVHNLMRMARGLGWGGLDPTVIMRVLEMTMQRSIPDAVGGA
jgi:3-hydroxyisobutyrate dehydrogenase-like beta-hydroxyacid dehydrogenase